MACVALTERSGAHAVAASRGLTSTFLSSYLAASCILHDQIGLSNVEELLKRLSKSIEMKLAPNKPTRPMPKKCLKQGHIAAIVSTTCKLALKHRYDIFLAC
eukprot:CAMPEP_0171706390 /NCGR_PEP_ID=MMETSP0991-20121206/13716_1 /TAXON_ID=483369 /ORGANISM="non described non described, Strain CCMP2098" /LENGTH=101 /DNA_ID=CAMNT_0012296021 /DNA_START=873 /DNA_END=1179 /DNA_ORIENTATION=-